MTGPTRRAVIALPAVVALSLCGMSWAQREPVGAEESPIVAGYEHLRAAGTATDALRGEVLLGELNCLSCHAVADASRNQIADRITTKPAPDLRSVGERATPAWLVAYLNDPHAEKPGTTMPDLLGGFPTAERDAIVERLTHFMVSRGDGMDAPRFAPFRFRAAVARGRATFHSIGCVACHAAEGEAGAAAIPDMPLPDLAAKTSVDALRGFLLDPSRARHGGRMPSLYLTDDEATDLAIYLLRDQEPDEVPTAAGFEFEYFLDPLRDEDAAGFFTRPPPVFDALDPAGTGTIAELSLDLPIDTRRGNHMFRFSGVIPVQVAGAYTFVLRSDRRSGSELLIDGRAIATKDRDTGRDISAAVELDVGRHAVEITYYIRGDTEQPFLDVTVEGGSIRGPVPIDRLAAYERVTLEPPDTSAFAPDPTLARAGRRLFTEVGCAACHALSTAAAGAAPLTPAPALEALDMQALGGNGPLHEARGAPRYNLAPHQRQAIGAALTDLDLLARPRDAGDQVIHTLATYNCYACHQRREDGTPVGGPDEVRGRHFRVVGNMDLGDEGRIPPTLTGIGGKLKPTALSSVLTESRLHVRRNYMAVRMPRFSGDPIAGLAADLERQDAAADDLRQPPLSAEAIEDGRTLVGSEGLRCITCHAVGAGLAQGISTVNLATVYDRARPGWLRRLLIDPHSINEGTRMLSYWADGAMIFPDIAGGTADGQIDAILAYLSLGSSMPAPEGTAIGNAMVLAPDDQPIVFRTFMNGVSPRAIVVGYPEAVHVAFDANVMRLAKAWRGGFFDAQGTWSGRAGRFFDPYGDDVVDMPPGPALAFLDTPQADWPPVSMTDRNVGGRFAGYRLDARQRPIFMYRLGTIAVEETFEPVVSAGGANLIRRFSLESGEVADGLYLLIAEGDAITRNDDGSWSVDDTMRVAVRSNVALQPFLRTSQGVRQLLLPIGLAGNQAVSIDVEISW